MNIPFNPVQVYPILEDDEKLPQDADKVDSDSSETKDEQ